MLTREELEQERAWAGGMPSVPRGRIWGGGCGVGNRYKFHSINPSVTKMNTFTVFFPITELVLLSPIPLNGDSLSVFITLFLELKEIRV